MTLAFDIEEPAPIPGGGPSNRLGPAISIPIPLTSVDLPLMGGDCILCGWSFEPTAGSVGALAELYDGASTGGVLLAGINLQGGADITAAQTPQGSTASGANASEVASITPAAGVLAFVTALRIDGLGATAAAQVTATLTGVLGGTRSYPVSVPAGVTVPITPVQDSFGTRGLQNSAAGQQISLTVPAFGAGNTLEEAEITGYFQSSIGFVDRQWFGLSGLYVRSGLFLHLISGSVKGTIYIRS
jgi:hypothetical protein